MCQSTQHTNDNATCFDYKIMIIIRPELQDAKRGLITTAPIPVNRGLRCGSAAAGFLGLWVRITPEAWMSVFCECCVLSGRVLCDGLITRPEESYRVWCA